jgi:shikimate dehydrogenase
VIKLGITGFPLAHTRSPAIHAGFLRARGLRGRYAVLPFDPAGGRRKFFAFLDGLAREGFRGINVTIPLKEWAFAYARGQAPGFDGACARSARAVNTLVFTSRGARGANTDARGFWDDVASWPAFAKAGRRGFELLVIGTGGSARGVLAGVVSGHALARRARRVRVRGRDRRKARALERWAGRTTRAGGEYPILIAWCLPPLSKATAAKLLKSALGEEAPAAGSFLYDLNYGARAESTRGLVPGSRRRAGLGMLRRQARASFKLWMGKKCPAPRR